MINARRMRCLSEAIRSGSVRAAADKLSMAPSAVSRQIALLETELGCQLVERHSRGVRSTGAGDIVLRHYRETCASEEDCLSDLRALDGLQQGHVNLAVGEGFVGDLMAGPVPQFRARYPGITLTIRLGGSLEVTRFVEEDEAHIGLLFHPVEKANVRSVVASQQDICAVVAPQHPLAALQRSVQLQECSQYPIALLEHSFGVSQLLAIAEYQERVRFQPVLRTSSISVLTQFAKANMGMTLLPAFVVRTELAEQQLRAVPIDNAVLRSGEAHIVCRVGRTLPEGAYQLLQYLRLWMRAFSEDGQVQSVRS